MPCDQSARRRLLREHTGATVYDVFRRAKHAVLVLGAKRLVVQPGMTGSLVVHPRPLEGEERTYAVLRARLDDGRELVYRDVRRLGTVLLLDGRGWERYDRAIGPEPLDAGFTAEDLGEALGRSRQSVKKVIMDQKHLAGVGNIYANEALYAAGIDPSKPARKLMPEDHRRLHREIQRILKAALHHTPSPYDTLQLEAIAERCNERQQAARSVERLGRKVAAAGWMATRIGEVFRALVTGVSSKGTFIRLMERPIEGKLVRSRRELDVGDRVQARLVDVQLEHGWIDFEEV